jgi:2,4-dienoyl-CoA reductase-like NADH-dependent reductase (Old Yellow Enzyme family)
MGDTFPHLLSEVSLGPVRLRNRVVSTSHQTSHVHDHLPTEDLVAYHEARARGGVGAVFLEATAVHASGLLTPHTIGGYLPGIVPAYRRLGAAIQGHGAALFVQLFHGGREQISTSPRPPAVAPSAVPTLRFRTEPRSLTGAEIRDIVAGFALSARRARQGDVDGVEVSMAHGYLAAQFFSPATNRRDDEYNGDLAARLRFARQVLEAVRAEAGQTMAVGVRLSAEEMTWGGLDPGECVDVARGLCGDGLVDFASLALGHSGYYDGSVYIVPPPPVPRNAIAAPAARIREVLGALPLVATTRVVDLADAEQLVASGTADVVGMTRALIADPELVDKAGAGQVDRVLGCIGCNQACIGHYHAGTPIGCVVNPRTGRERTWPVVVSGSSRRRVLVVGGGPAGVAAATEAGRAGDDVTLVERAEAIGGQLRLAGRTVAHAEIWERYRRNAERDLAAAGVTLRLGEDADPAAADGYDLVVVATGARPYIPPLPDGLPFPVVHAWEAISHPDSVAGPALVADWGGEWGGLDAAESLARAGKEVTLACAATVPGEQVHQYQRNSYLARLDVLGVRILHHFHLQTLPEIVLRHVFSGRAQPIGPIATLVLAQGRQPDDDLWRALEGRPGVVRAGDVLAPRSAEEAILEGARAVHQGGAPLLAGSRPR